MRLNLWNNQSPSKTFIPTHAYIYADSQAHTFLKTFRLPTQSIKQSSKLFSGLLLDLKIMLNLGQLKLGDEFENLFLVFYRECFWDRDLLLDYYAHHHILKATFIPWKKETKFMWILFFSYWNQQMRVTQSWHFEIFLKKLICWRQSLFSWQADFFHKVLLLGTCLCCSDVNSFSCPIFLTEITEVCCSHPLNHGIFSYCTPNWKMGFRMFWS